MCGFNLNELHIYILRVCSFDFENFKKYINFIHFSSFPHNVHVEEGFVGFIQRIGGEGWIFDQMIICMDMNTCTGNLSYPPSSLFVILIVRHYYFV